MSRLSNSWSLVKASWAVLRADKELIVFPIIAFIGSIIVTITFIVPMALTRMFDRLSDGGGSQGDESRRATKGSRSKRHWRPRPQSYERPEL